MRAGQAAGARPSQGACAIACVLRAHLTRCAVHAGQDQAALLERRAALCISRRHSNPTATARQAGPRSPSSVRPNPNPNPHPYQTVSHFAGEVVYEAAGWRERNNDELHRDLLTLLGDTYHELLGQLFESAEESTSFETGTVKTPTIAQVFAL